MSKINIKVSIKNNEKEEQYETIAIIQDNILKYQEKDNTIVIFNYDENTLTRENNELLLKYRYSDISEGTIYIKELDREIKVNIKTIKLERKENDIKINFMIENNIFLYEIEEIK